MVDMRALIQNLADFGEFSSTHSMDNSVEANMTGQRDYIWQRTNTHIRKKTITQQPVTAMLRQTPENTTQTQGEGKQHRKTL